MDIKTRQIIKTLNKIGVDTRYISFYQNTIYINNLKFSKFSRKKEDTFHETYPQIPIIRSKIFQKICIKTSRTLKNQIKPKDHIYTPNTDKPEDILINIILEPYQRKYGITITHNDNDENIKYTNNQTLTQFINQYLNQMINSQKIEEKKDPNTIYPLEDIPDEWIYEWIKTTNIKHTTKIRQTQPEIIKISQFIKKHIPQYEQSIKQSVKNLNRDN